MASNTFTYIYAPGDSRPIKVHPVVTVYPHLYEEVKRTKIPKKCRDEFMHVLSFRVKTLNFKAEKTTRN